MKKIVWTISLVVLMSLCIAPVMAQFGEPRGGFGGRGRGGGPHDRQDFEKRMKAIEQYRMFKLLEVLDLNDEQATTFLQMFKQQREQMKQFREERHATADTLSQVLETADADAEINRLIDKLQANKRREIEFFDSFFKDIKGLLNSYQMGRLVLFMERFDREMIKGVLERHGEQSSDESLEPSEGK